MKDRDLIKLDELRSVLARISSAEAVTPTQAITNHAGPIAGARPGVGTTEAERKKLTIQDIESVLNDEKSELESALAMTSLPADYADKLHLRTAVIQKYL